MSYFDAKIHIFQASVTHFRNGWQVCRLLIIDWRVLTLFEIESKANNNNGNGNGGTMVDYVGDWFSILYCGVPVWIYLPHSAINILIGLDWKQILFRLHLKSEHLLSLFLIVINLDLLTLALCSSRSVSSSQPGSWICFESPSFSSSGTEQQSRIYISSR